MSVNLPANLPSVARAKLPAMYSSAKDALAKCERLDECKDWADKAEALASYAKQAQDDELRKTADRIQARAIRRCGQLLGEIQQARGVRTDRAPSAGDRTKSTRKEAARAAGLSHHQQHTALRVARVAADEFEDAVEGQDPPTVTALADRGRLPAPRVDLHGRDPRDFKAATAAMGVIRETLVFCRANDPKAAAAGLLPREAKRRDVIDGECKEIKEWLSTFVRSIERANA